MQRSIHKASCRSIKCWMRSWLSRQYVDCSGSAAVETLKPSCVCSGWLRAGAMRQEPRGRTARVQGLYAGESTRRNRASIHPSSRRFEQAHTCVMAMARSYALNGVERDSCCAECKRLHAIVHEQTNDTLEKASLLDRALAASQELEKLQDEALVARQVHCTIVPRVPEPFGHTIVYAGLTRCDTHRRCSSDNKNSNTNLRKHEQSAKAFVPRSRAPSRKCNDPRPHTRHDC